MRTWMSYAATEASAAAARSHLCSIPSKSSQVTPPLCTLSTLFSTLTCNPKALQADCCLVQDANVAHEVEQVILCQPALPGCAGKVLTSCPFTLKYVPDRTIWHLQRASNPPDTTDIPLSGSCTLIVHLSYAPSGRLGRTQPALQ